MPRQTIKELCIANLQEQVPKGQLGYMTKAQARDELANMTGQNFGLDADRWEEWLRSNRIAPTLCVTDPKEAVRLARRRAREQQ